MILSHHGINLISRLGPGAFESISGEIVKAVLLNLGVLQKARGAYFGIDVSEARGIENKAENLRATELAKVSEKSLDASTDFVIRLSDLDSGMQFLSDYSISMRGIVSGDNDKWVRMFSELPTLGKWRPYQGTPGKTLLFGGRSNIINWSTAGAGMLRPGTKNEAYGRRGVAVGQIGNLPATLFDGHLYDNSTGVVVPFFESQEAVIWAFLNSEEYSKTIREIDQALKVTNATLIKAPFDVEYWTKIAAERYPNGLPQPYTNDPTQWIFHGHPCGSVIWDETTKWTAHGPLRNDDTVLHIAVARLLGYRWPAELDAEMELAAEQREWVNRCEDLLTYADDDGIVCLQVVRSEEAADERLEALLQAAYGESWSSQVRNQLLEAAGCKNKSLAFWLREKFFEQHCKLFQHRPFIWHIWDGLKDGFSALVNYHLLDKKNLERLIYTYLDDWIRTQNHALNAGKDGASERLVAAQNLKKSLELILEGEEPYDIFVRWKPLDQQPIGWEPDLNDGVRLNIRPFLSVDDVGKKGAGILRAKPNIKWTKDRGKDVESAPWYHLGPEYGESEGARINDHHLSLEEKRKARDA